MVAEDSGSIWQGKRVLLRAVEPGDWEAFLALDRDSGADRDGWQVHPPRGAEGAKRWALEQSQRDGKDDNFGWAIQLIDGPIAGHVNVHGADRKDGTFEYGISVGRAFWGQGIAADALEVLLRFYFDDLRYHRVSGIVYAYNERSQRFHEKFGFVCEGRIREYHFTLGRHHDIMWYGMTVAEFRDRYGANR